MKKIGFVGVAEACTVSGEVTLALAVGLETVSGKSSAPFAHCVLAGSSAVGAGILLLFVQVICSGGIEG